MMNRRGVRRVSARRNAAAYNCRDDNRPMAQNLQTARVIRRGADDALAAARRVLDIEARALAEIAANLNADFCRACEILLAAEGKIAVAGVGKSGHIARKLAATFSSTGTGAFFIHPTEAAHGDLGMLDARDCVLAVSYSGESAEFALILPRLKRLGLPLIALCGRADSTLARAADVFLSIAVSREACPLNLAPTASTTAALALGDALALALLEARGFSPDDFARTHPSGALGRRLLLTVADVMRAGDALPLVGRDATLSAAIMEMTKKQMGMTLIADGDGRLAGIFTDGDLRRALAPGRDIFTAAIGGLMTPAPHTVAAGDLAADAARLMQEKQIGQLPVVDGAGGIDGALTMHDLMRGKVI